MRSIARKTYSPVILPVKPIFNVIMSFFTRAGKSRDYPRYTLTLFNLNCLIFDFELSSRMFSRISFTSVFGEIDLLFLGFLEPFVCESADDSEDKPLLRL